MKVRSFSLAVVVGFAGACHAWTSYDFENGFGTSTAGHSKFLYGTKLNIASTTLFVFTVQTPITVGSVVMPTWWFNDNSYSRIYNNPSGSTLNFGEGTILPGNGTMLHPDLNRPTAVRFMGDPGVSYQTVFRWTRLGQSGSVVASVVENGSLRDTQTVSQVHVPTDWQWTPATVFAPVALDFCVEQNGAATWDSTQLEALVYEIGATNVSFTMVQPEYVGSLLNYPVTAQTTSGKYPSPLVTIGTSVAGIGSYACPFLGAISVYLKPKHFLRKKVSMYLLTSGFDIGNLTFINGDVDEDNVISVFDYILLSNAFDSTPTDSNWLANADLDGDEVVSVFDYIILSDNFDAQGD